MNTSSKNILDLLNQLEKASTLDAVSISEQIRHASSERLQRSPRPKRERPFVASTAEGLHSRTEDLFRSKAAPDQSEHLRNAEIETNEASLAVSVEELKQIAETLEELRKATSEFGVVFGTLSLNSSVEAAIAGESGKEFASAADKFRHLSNDFGTIVKDASIAVRNGLSAMTAAFTKSAAHSAAKNGESEHFLHEADNDRALRAVVENISILIGREPRLIDLHRDLKSDLGIDSARHRELVAGLIAEMPSSMKSGLQKEKQNLLKARTVEDLLRIVSTFVVRTNLGAAASQAAIDESDSTFQRF